MDIGYIGLGKMGFNMVERLIEKGHHVIASDVNAAQVALIASKGAAAAANLSDLAGRLTPRRVVWIMVPHQFVDGVLGELLPLLSPDDIVIDGGNSFFEDSVRRFGECKMRGVAYLDVGTSGGPNGARNGACIMVGGERSVYDYVEPLFRDLAQENGFAYVGNSGAGHFVKMVHNGIEYGMMQAIGEGFAVMKASPFNVQLETTANLFQHGSVIESHLVEWLRDGYRKYGEDLKEISGSVANSGEGAWTVDTAKKYHVPTPIIAGSLNFRIASENDPSYIGQVVSVMRNQFGGHEVKAKS
jgi:6-phosphogluconate dehydrogenase